MKTIPLKSRFFQSVAIIALCASTYSQAAAESIGGVLEQSGAYSALFTVSPESGDLIAYPFKNNSAVGKTILANCLPGLVCKVAKATTREMQDPTVLKFKDQAMGWIEITRAANVGMVSSISNYEKSSKTRFGILSVNDESRTLFFKGKPVLPNVEGNNSLSIVASFELGKNDVVLLQNTGGTACPALYLFVTINATSIRPTPEFGTCSDIINPTSDMKSSVTVVMNGFMGQFESTVAYRKAQMTKTIFRYANGLILPGETGSK